jgi:putative lipoic acid-binding regulatory protein
MEDFKAFKEKLEDVHNFPTLYMFKFIVPKDKVSEVDALFPKNEVSIKPSSSGKYISTTIKSMMESADHIIEVYKEAKKIEGIISL